MSFTRLKRKHRRPTRETSKRRVGGSERSKSAGRLADEISEEDLRITESSGNVFLDMGFSPEEARSLQLRSNLMIDITEIIRAQKLTQAKAAKLFGVTQPRISDLMRGKIERFSIDTLLAMLWRAGFRYEIAIAPRAA